VHTKMHVLDVISSVSGSSIFNKIVGVSAPIAILAGFKRPTLRPILLRGVEGREGERRQNDASGARNPRAATARPR